MLIGTNCPTCTRDEIAPFYVRYPAAAGKVYADALRKRTGRAARLQRNDRLLEERRLGVDVAMRKRALDGLVAKVSGAGAGAVALRDSIRRCNWSATDDQFIREHYAKRGAAWCSRRIGRTISACRVRAGKLGVSAPPSASPSPWRAWKPEADTGGARRRCAPRPGGHRKVGTTKRPPAPFKGSVHNGRGPRGEWSEREIEYLRKHYATRGALVCGHQLNRSESAVRQRAARLGLRVQEFRWSPQEDRILRAFACRGIHAIGKALGKVRGTPFRSPEAIKTRAGTLKVPTATARVRWSAKEDRIICRHLRRGNLDDVIARLGGKRSRAAIVTRASALRRRGEM